MVTALRARFDLPQLDARVRGGGAQHSLKAFGGHEVAARRGRKVAAARQQAHRAQVDLLVPLFGVVRRAARLCERRGIEDDEVIGLFVRGLELREQVEDVGGEKVHFVLKAVARRVRARHFDGALGHVHRRHVLCAAFSGVERERARVREAVEHALAVREVRDGEAIELLVEEKARLLPVFDIHTVENAVLANFSDGALGRFFAGEGKPTLVLRQALLFAKHDIVALKKAVDRLAVLLQHLDNEGEEHVLDLFHAERERLRDEKIFKPVDRQAGEGVRLAEDQAAAAGLPVHDRLAVVPGVAYAPPPEIFIKAVVRVARDNAHAELTESAQKARAEIFALFRHHVDERTVFALALVRLAGDVGVVHPGVAALEPARALGGDGQDRIVACSFHRSKFLL